MGDVFACVVKIAQDGSVYSLSFSAMEIDRLLLRFCFRLIRVRQMLPRFSVKEMRDDSWGIFYAWLDDCLVHISSLYKR